MIPATNALFADSAEAELVARIQAGDQAACETLVRRHGGPLCAVARRYLGNDEDCADAVQDAFLAAFRSLDSFSGNARIGTWLHRIVVNVSLMKLRSRRRRPTVSIEALLPDFDETGHHVRPVLPWSMSSEEILQSAEKRRLIRLCIDRLPEQYRTVLIMRDIDGLGTEETRQLLGLNASAVKTRLHRARQALRTLLAPLFETGADDEKQSRGRITQHRSNASA